LAAFAAIGLSVTTLHAQDKRRNSIGRGDFDSDPAPPTAGAAAPASTPKVTLTPRSLPGAVVSPDPKLVAGAPFNTKDYFAVPAEEANAGPLVLDALSDFPDVYAAVVGANDPGVQERAQRAKTALDWLQANPNPRSWDANAVEQAFGPYRATFAKLHEAHKKTDCVIPTGIGVESALPHVQASMQVVRFAAPLIFADLARGDRTGATRIFGDALRLGLDLQTRAGAVTGLTIVTMHRIMAENALPILLNARGLTQSDYDAILEALKSYRAGSINLLPEMLKTEYLVQIHNLNGMNEPNGLDKFLEFARSSGASGPVFDPQNAEKAKKTFGALFKEENVVKLKAGLARTLKSQLSAIDSIGSLDDIQAIGDELNKIARTTLGAVMGEVLSKETIVELVGLSAGTNPQAAEAAREIAKADPKTISETLAPQIGLSTSPDMKLVVVPVLYFQNDQGIMESLTSIRRWYVTKKSVPKDKTLDEICKEAGLEAAPLDIFAGKPMRMIWTGSGPAVSTSAHDFKDDEGKVFLAPADRGKTSAPVSGDYVVTLALGADPAAPAQASPGGIPGAPGAVSIPGGQGGAIAPGPGATSGGRRRD
jgi:hypothetical protein